MGSPTTRSVRARVLRGLATLAAGAAVVLATATAAHADDTRVAHLERTPTGFSVLLDVPDGVNVDLGAVTATVNGQAYPTTAEQATTETAVSRTAVIAIDTSDSMEGDKIAAARDAAKVFLDTAPANLRIGVVTFDSAVTDALAPTTDRAAATRVINHLELAKGTRLNDGVLAALKLSGDSGQRALIVLSDGADTNSSASIDDVTTALDAAKVGVDVVALDQSGIDLTTLQQIAGPDGTVISAAANTLTSTFSDEAAALSRQIAVAVTVPADVAKAQSSVAVSIPNDAGDPLTASALLTEQTVPTTDPGLNTGSAAPVDTGSGTPRWVLYAGVGVFGGGLLGALVMLAPAKPVPMTAEARVTTYTQTTRTGAAPPREQNEAVLDQARDAVAQVLSRNRDLDQRITLRLDGAGSDLKSSEFILINAGVILLATVVGLLLGRGNLIVGLLFLILGAVGPWFSLGFRRSARRKRFNSVLPETLQLISGSLSAGLSLAQSVDTIVREGAEPISSEFRRVLVETRLGIPLEDAFEGVAERFESKDFAWVVMAIRIQRQVGGNLAELLDTVAATMREREYVRRQVAALAAEGKLSAYVLGFLPPLFLLYLTLTNYAYVKPLYTVPLGWAMLTGGVALLSVGVFWMSRLVKVEV